MLGLIYPEVCQLCRVERAGASSGFVCDRCRLQVRFIRPPFCDRCGLPFEGDLTTKFVCSNCHDIRLYFSSARSAVAARTVVLEAIHRYKYSRSIWFERFLADLLISEAVGPLKEGGWDFIVPVPLHPVKQREREFNQAARLAEHLSRAAGIPVNHNILRRVNPTHTQTRLTREQRVANMLNAFAASARHRLKGMRIVILDDVLTTGATTNACAKALRDSGAEEVCVWTVARRL